MNNKVKLIVLNSFIDKGNQISQDIAFILHYVVYVKNVVFFPI